MHSDTPVTLPTITAEQRQTLISVLENEVKRRGLGDHASDDVIALAHALDLHNDAVRAEPPAGNAAPDERLICIKGEWYVYTAGPFGTREAAERRLVGNPAPDLDTCDRCGKAEERIHVGHESTLGYDGLCEACYLSAPEVQR